MTFDRTLVFSGDPDAPTCVDCGLDASKRLVYRRYTVNDLVCNDHAAHRLTVLTEELGAGAVIARQIPASFVIVTSDLEDVA